MPCLKDMKMQLPKNLEKLCDLIVKNGFKAYIAGGAVRDFLLERTPVDFDIATDAKPENVMSILNESGIRGVDVNAKFGTVLAVFGSDETYEITTFRKEGSYSDKRRPDSVEFTSAEEDAKRRDFTVNGLFYDTEKNEVIDFVDGKSDLNKKVVRFIGLPEERIQEDHLRLLRFARFVHTLGFEANGESEQAVKKHARLIENISGERIREEMNKAFAAPHPSHFIQLLDEYGLLEILLPEVKALQGLYQGPRYHSEGDGYEHTLLCLDSLPDNAGMQLVWATLLHDIGKKETQEIKGEFVTFYGHDKVSGRLAENIFKRLKFPKKESEPILFAIKKHMHMHKMNEMREGKRINLVRHEYFPLLFQLYRADMHGSVPKDPKIREKDYGKIAEIEDLYHRERDEKYPPLVTGQDLIDMGMKPGPEFTDILEEVYHLQLEKKLRTKEEAIEFIKDNGNTDWGN